METEGPGMRDTYAPSPGLRLAFHGLPDQGPTSPLAEQECYPHLGAGGWGGVGEETPTLARLTGSRLEPHSHPGTHGRPEVCIAVDRAVTKLLVGAHLGLPSGGLGPQMLEVSRVGAFEEDLRPGTCSCELPSPALGVGCAPAWERDSDLAADAS